ncbi:hypothetical protein [Cohnella sp. LGH]|uniref:hypothetical protein n=1 Tax=Cohnella sp. LGH TaxID=1619153 RepID=UPI001FFE26CA|nr:hypothetical protein [Cohnella sp. LGH]
MPELFATGAAGTLSLSNNTPLSTMTVNNVPVTAADNVKIDYAIQINSVITIGIVNLTVTLVLQRNGTSIQTIQYASAGLATGSQIQPISYTFVDNPPSTAVVDYSVQVTYSATGIGAAAVTVSNRYMNVANFQ